KKGHKGDAGCARNFLREVSIPSRGTLVLMNLQREIAVIKAQLVRIYDGFRFGFFCRLVVGMKSSQKLVIAKGDVSILTLKTKKGIFSTNQISIKRVELGILLGKGAFQLRYHRPQ
ncbi:unnamed protein product, partial [Prunus brigantina]